MFNFAHFALVGLVAVALPAAAQYSPVPDFVSPTEGRTAQLQVAVGGSAAISGLVIYDDPNTCRSPRRVRRLENPLQLSADRQLTFTAYLTKGDYACRITSSFQPKAGHFYELYSVLRQDACVILVGYSERQEGPYLKLRDIEQLRYVPGDSPGNSFCEAK